MVIEGAVPLQSRGIPFLQAWNMENSVVGSAKPWVHQGNLAEMAVRHETRAAKVALKFILMPC